MVSVQATGRMNFHLKCRPKQVADINDFPSKYIQVPINYYYPLPEYKYPTNITIIGY